MRLIAHLRPTLKPYPKQPKHNKGVTLVIEFEYTNPQIKVFLAKCHKTDTYNKKKGVQQALESDPIELNFPDPNFKDLYLLVEEVAKIAQKYPLNQVTEKILSLVIRKNVTVQAPLISSRQTVNGR